jgi:hypothetical protein
MRGQIDHGHNTLDLLSAPHSNLHPVWIVHLSAEVECREPSRPPSGQRQRPHPCLASQGCPQSESATELATRKPKPTQPDDS